MKTETAARSVAPSTPALVVVPPLPVGPAALASTLARAALAHPFVKDKAPAAIASRVARKLNSARVPPPAGEPYWTGPLVLPLLAG